MIYDIKIKISWEKWKVISEKGCITKKDKKVEEDYYEYREKCKSANLEIKEPYYNNIVHATLFRFTKKLDPTIFMKKFEYYLNNNINYGYVTIDNFNIGYGTWKLNSNEIVINHTIKLKFS